MLCRRAHKNPQQTDKYQDATKPIISLFFPLTAGTSQSGELEPNGGTTENCVNLWYGQQNALNDEDCSDTRSRPACEVYPFTVWHMWTPYEGS